MGKSLREMILKWDMEDIFEFEADSDPGNSADDETSLIAETMLASFMPPPGKPAPDKPANIKLNADEVHRRAASSPPKKKFGSKTAKFKNIPESPSKKKKGGGGPAVFGLSQWAAEKAELLLRFSEEIERLRNLVE